MASKHDYVFNNFQSKMCLCYGAWSILKCLTMLKQNIYNCLKNTEACLIVLEAQNSVYAETRL